MFISFRIILSFSLQWHWMKLFLVPMLTLKNAQPKCCNLSFIWGKVRTAAQNTAPQIALRNCSKEAGWIGHHVCDFGEGGVKRVCFSRRFLLVSWSCLLVIETVVTMKDFSAFLDMRRYRNWAHKISFWKYLTIWRPVLPVFHWGQSTEYLISALHPELLLGSVENQQVQQHMIWFLKR